jgi:hypothetical protein
LGVDSTTGKEAAVTLTIKIMAFVATAICTILVFAGVEGARRLSRKIYAVAAVIVVSAYGICLVTQPSSWLLADALVLLAAVVLGGVLSRAANSEAALVAFLMAAIIDAFSATGGLTSKIVDSYAAGQSRLLQYLSISVPITGRIVPIVGVGDLLFASAIMHTLSRFRHPRIAVLLVPLGGLMLALILAFTTRFIAGLPSVAAVTTAYLLLHKRAVARTISAPPQYQPEAER